MKPVDFKQVNFLIAEGQEEYETLPAYIEEAETGTIVTCFELDNEEIEEINRTGKIWHQQLAFHQPMQPILLSTLCPFEEEDEKKENEPKCNCKSYNLTTLGGEKESVVLDFPFTEGKTVCIDACIAEEIQKMWQYGFITSGSCCGHNKNSPSVIVDQSQSKEHREWIDQHLERKWDVLSWKLVRD